MWTFPHYSHQYIYLQARENQLSQIQTDLSQLSLGIHHHVTDSGVQVPELQQELQHLYQLTDHLNHWSVSRLELGSVTCNCINSGNCIQHTVVCWVICPPSQFVTVT